ncbi:hypothetical protein ES703_90571 [subsurface metagenome]
MDEISSSERIIIQKILKKYGSLNANQLCEESHKHPASKRNKDKKLVGYFNAFKEKEKKEQFKVWEREVKAIDKALS